MPDLDIRNIAELTRWFQKSGIFYYARLSVDDTSTKGLNFTKIDDYFDRYQIDFSNEDNPRLSKYSI